ncbi:MAG: inorganic phosphate transporter, partial [Negativicutes bacterium]|nr:inorganic phosphate transporter [Negativicutes bacterium]
MPEAGICIVIIVVLALLFDYINGFNDTANAIATSVSTRALSPRAAVLMAAVLNFAGAFTSTGVAKTIGGEIIEPDYSLDNIVVIAGLIGAIAWNFTTWRLALPSSSSHALIGGLVGATLVDGGWQALHLSGIAVIVAGLVLSPVVSWFGGTMLMIAVLRLFGRMPPSRLDQRFKRMQCLAAAAMSFAHGANDAQKGMGVITMSLLAAGLIGSFVVPLWVQVAAAAAMALGTATGGWRIIRTMGGKISKLVPISGFSADMNSSLVILVATFMHLPVSTTHVVSG